MERPLSWKAEFKKLLTKLNADIYVGLSADVIAEELINHMSQLKHEIERNKKLGD